MAERFKVEVKHTAQRRSRRQGQPGTGDNDFVVLSEQDFIPLSTKLGTRPGGAVLSTALLSDDTNISLLSTSTDLNPAIKVPIRKLPVSSVGYILHPFLPSAPAMKTSSFSS